MPFFLIEPDLDLSIELPMPGQIERVFQLQWERLANPGVRDAFVQRLSQGLSTVLPDLLDWDLRPPSEKQLAYATALSRKLNVRIPPDALQFRGCMHDFLDKYASLAKKT